MLGLNAIRLRRRQFVGVLALSALGQFRLPIARAAAQAGVVTPDGRTYTAYVPAATKAGQFYQYSCEFDAAWVVLATFGHDVPFEEQLAIVTGLWRTPAGQRFTFHGKHYTLTDSPALPKPVQAGGPPIIVGGHGPKRTPALAARYADEFNVAFGTLEQTRQAFERVSAACEEHERNASGRTAPVLSAAQTITVGRTEQEVRRRCERIRS